MWLGRCPTCLSMFLPELVIGTVLRCCVWGISCRAVGLALAEPLAELGLTGSSLWRVPRVTWLPSRVGYGGEDAGEDTQEHQGLSERSQAVGAVLSLLLVALTGCLLTLLLYKKERR